MENLLTVKNYKEPLKKVENGNGFGYYGAISQTNDSKYIQCHICGELFAHLGGHIIQKHQVRVRDYKIKYGIQMGTALLSDNEREKRKQAMANFLKRMDEDQRKEYFESARKGAEKAAKERKYKHTFPHSLALEYKNKKGTCPDQILTKIRLLWDKLGRMPKLEEFSQEYGGNYRHIVYITFGSWNDALLKVDPNAPITKNYSKKRYSNEDLLERLRRFTREMGRFPTNEDCNRGFLPSSYTYYHRFGGLIKARELAGILVPEYEGIA